LPIFEIWKRKTEQLRLEPTELRYRSEHSKEDMLKIARSHLPEGDARSLKLLAGYALGTEKKQVSGIVEALESARYRAKQDGRSEATFADIEAALINDHKFLNPAPTADLQSAHTSVGRPVKPSGKEVARLQISSPGRAGDDSELPISDRLGPRSTTESTLRLTFCKARRI
jgi:hypothetical protein